MKNIGHRGSLLQKDYLPFVYLLFHLTAVWPPSARDGPSEHHVRGNTANGTQNTTIAKY